MCLIIAEAGENHSGDMELAKKMIDLSKISGADYVKFQYYNADNCSNNDPEKEWFKVVQLDIEKIKCLRDYANQKDIQFLCTPWEAQKAAELFSIGIMDMKIASFHIADLEMLKLINERGRRVFMSTGASSLDEIDAAVNLLQKVDLYLLHCVSEYPLPEENVNLKVMDFFRKRYGCNVGYSDHTLGILAPLAAVARGADVIEKHITMSKTFQGTDHILSADPSELKLLVEYTRRLELILGTEEKRITAKEMGVQQFLRNRFSSFNE